MMELNLENLSYLVGTFLAVHAAFIVPLWRKLTTIDSKLDGRTESLRTEFAQRIKEQDEERRADFSSLQSAIAGEQIQIRSRVEKIESGCLNCRGEYEKRLAALTDKLDALLNAVSQSPTRGELNETFSTMVRGELFRSIRNDNRKDTET